MFRAAVVPWCIEIHHSVPLKSLELNHLGAIALPCNGLALIMQGYNSGSHPGRGGGREEEHTYSAVSLSHTQPLTKLGQEYTVTHACVLASWLA